MCVGGETVYNISLVLREKNGQFDSSYRLDLSQHVLCCVSHFSVNMAIQCELVDVEMMHVWRAWQVEVNMYGISFSLLPPCF